MPSDADVVNDAASSTAAPQANGDATAPPGSSPPPITCPADSVEQPDTTQAPPGGSASPAAVMQVSLNGSTDVPLTASFVMQAPPGGSSGARPSLSVNSFASVNSSSFVSPASDGWEFVDDDPPLGVPV
ncbi:PREDICTED: protein transport protein SEC31-like [Priapulus caudatus]|uniref:Protein transport protein SEC31-like n=1 Tax=Priapulus caudatus TaxID=37621 RepID=A0ABM1DT45_PRICU|nr:PREDICTED: protein transport protein SEC31-like [Priapulus caudatus]